jgi:hypothetical protein
VQIVNETLPALRKLKERGLVRFIGITGLPLRIYQYILDRQPPLTSLFSICTHTDVHTDTHTHTHREREREREGVSVCLCSKTALVLLCPLNQESPHGSP